MFLNLPDRIFFEKEISRKVIQQNTFNWDGYFHLTSNDPNLHLDYTDHDIDDVNYIILYPSDRTNRTSTINVSLTSDSNGSNVIQSYSHSVDLIFEDNLTWKYTYYPEPKHFQWKLPNGDINQDFKLHVTKFITEPRWRVDSLGWRGYQCIGLSLKGTVVVEIPINKFIPNNISWDYAIVRGHRLGNGTTLGYKNTDGIVKPITFTFANREIEIILKPNESIYYYGIDDVDYSGFGITSIQFFSE